jgi:flagellar biosynthetic protein FliR
MDSTLTLSLPYFELIHMIAVSTRVGAALLFAPIWGYPGLPAHLRVMLLFSTAFMIAGVTPSDATAYADPVTAILREFFVGLLLGMGIRIVFAGLHFGGHMIGYHLGYSAVQAIDPTTANRSTLMSGFMTLVGYGLILATNQHHGILRAVAGSYQAFPAGATVRADQWFGALFASAAQMFVIGWKIALPVFAVTLLAEVAVGVVVRMQPQINTMVITMPLKLCVGLLALGASLAMLPAVIDQAMNLRVIGR